MADLKQRVALAKDESGKPVFITLEWLKELQALSNSRASLEARIAELLARIEQLENEA